MIRDLTRRAIVADGDNTLWAGNVANGIGMGLLLRELRRGRADRFINGIRGRRDVQQKIRSMPGIEGEVAGQRRFYEILIENDVGTEDRCRGMQRST